MMSEINLSGRVAEHIYFLWALGRASTWVVFDSQFQVLVLVHLQKCAASFSVVLVNS